MSAVVDHMTTRYRLAGTPERRAMLARRLDRVVAERLTGALETLCPPQETGGDEGPVICIRRLRLALWLDLARMDDGATARAWAEAILRAIHRVLAEGGPSEVMRFPSEAARLAAWAVDMASGTAEMRWYWHDFRHVHDLPAGRAISVTLGRAPDRLAEVMSLLAAGDTAQQVLSSFTAEDVSRIWLAWTGASPDPGRPVGPRLIARVATVSPPPAEPATSAGRARMALGWLVALTTGPDALPPESAARMALQLAHVAALASLRRDLRLALLERHLDIPRMRALLAGLPSELAAPRDWAQAALDTEDGPGALAALARIATGGRPSAPPATRPVSAPDRLRSAYAGAALLIPAIARLALAPRLGAHGLHWLFAASVGRRNALLARYDPGLRWLSGLGEDADPDHLPVPDWPDAAALGLAPERLARDAGTHGTGPELPALRAAADLFTEGLRGMPGSSLGYLAQQFFHRSATLTRDTGALVVRLDPVPLGIVLRMAGRFGDLGEPEWLGGRRLILEIADG